MNRFAPCGHIGEPIIGTYVACLAGCDGRPRACGRCGSPHIGPFSAAAIPKNSWHCLPCGFVWWSWRHA